MKHFAYAYPWNLHGAAEAASALSELGLDGLNLAVSYHAGKFIHPGDPRRVYFPEDGTVYFDPRNKYGLLQPLKSTVCEKTDGGLLNAQGVAINGWMVLCHNSRLGESNPQCVARNAFGDPYHYSLCPSNRHVRDYTVTLAADFANHHDVGSLLLETPGFLTYAHGYHHEFAQLRPNPYLDALLGLCFCGSCASGAASAGIDFSGLRTAVAQAVDAYLAQEGEFDHADGLEALDRANAEIPDLRQFHAWRAEQVTSLVTEIREQVRPEVAVRTIATTQRPHSTAYLEGMDLAALAKAADGIECPLYQPDLEGLADDLAWLRDRIDPGASSAILRPAWPDWQSEESLRAAFAMVHDQGFEQINFYNLGMLRPANRRWLQRLLKA